MALLALLVALWSVLLVFEDMALLALLVALWSVLLVFEDGSATKEDSHHIHKPDAVNGTTEQLRKILDTKFEPADLDEVLPEQEQLSDKECQPLMKAPLEKHRQLSSRMPGQWKGNPCNIELKKDAETYHAKGFPVPGVHLETVKMEVQDWWKLVCSRR